jgi:hypothetical protein
MQLPPAGGDVVVCVVVGGGGGGAACVVVVRCVVAGGGGGGAACVVVVGGGLAWVVAVCIVVVAATAWWATLAWCAFAFALALAGLAVVVVVDVVVVGVDWVVVAAALWGGACEVDEADPHAATSSASRATAIGMRRCLIGVSRPPGLGGLSQKDARGVGLLPGSEQPVNAAPSPSNWL